MLLPPVYVGLRPFDSQSSCVPPEKHPSNTTTLPSIEQLAAHWHREVDFRHRGWSRDRHRVEKALRSADVGFNRQISFHCCGSGARIVQSVEDPTDYRLRANYCHDRFCKPCATARAALVATNIAEIAPRGTLRFVTLTLAGDNKLLDETIDRIFKAFRRLRALPRWKRNVYGGAAFLETKWNDDVNRWHTHLHLIVEGDYYDKPQLREDWLKATGDSHIVHISLIRDKRATMRYALKYGSKGLDTATLRNPDRLVEAVRALHGRRLVTTFATWRGMKTKPEKTTGEWNEIGRLGKMLDDAVDGNDDAIYVLSRLGIDSNRFGPPVSEENPP